VIDRSMPSRVGAGGARGAAGVLAGVAFDLLCLADWPIRRQI
jgi:hypothetical protein